MQIKNYIGLHEFHLYTILRMPSTFEPMALTPSTTCAETVHLLTYLRDSETYLQQGQKNTLPARGRQDAQAASESYLLQVFTSMG